MPAFGINTGSIAQETLQSYRSGVDRANELAAKKRQAQMDRENLRARGLANDIAQSEASDRLAGIRLQNDNTQQLMDIRASKAPVEVEQLEANVDKTRQGIDVIEEQRDPRLQALYEEVRHAKVSNPLSEQAQRIDNQGRVLDNRGKVLANSMDEFRTLAMSRTNAIDTATHNDKLRTSVNDAERASKVSDAKLDNVGDEIALNNATMERDISQAGADQAAADTARTTSEYEGLEAKAKLTVMGDLRANLQDTAKADILAKEMKAKNDVFMGRLTEIENSEGKVSEAMTEERYKRMGSVLLTVRELNDGTEAGKQRAINAIRNSPLFQNPDIVDIEFTDDGKVRAIGKDGKTFVDKNGFDDKGNPDKFEFNMNSFNEDLLPYAFQDSEIEDKLKLKAASTTGKNPVPAVDANNKYQPKLVEATNKSRGAKYGVDYDEDEESYDFSPLQNEEVDYLNAQASQIMRDEKISYSEAQDKAAQFTDLYDQLKPIGLTRKRVQQELTRHLGNESDNAPSELHLLRRYIERYKNEGKIQ